MSYSNNRRIKGEWKDHLPAAKVAWSRLTEEELLKSDGDIEKLVNLVEKRYGIIASEAEFQVRLFLTRNVHI